MKLKEKIYVPYRLIEKTATGELEKQFCLDSKNRLRIYTSMETLREYMPEEYFDIAVYELKQCRLAGKPQKQKMSRKLKRKLRKMAKDQRRIDEMQRWSFYKDFPLINSNISIFPGICDERKILKKNKIRF